jgi:hypothetical protein
MMRFSVRFAFGLLFLFATSSIAAAQVAPVVQGGTKARDPRLIRPFNGVTFGQAAPTRPMVGWPETRFRALDTLGAPLPSVTTAPEPHGSAPRCVMRVVPVDPNFKSSMPTVNVDQRADPKSVIKVFCQPTVG